MTKYTIWAYDIMPNDLILESRDEHHSAAKRVKTVKSERDNSGIHTTVEFVDGVTKKYYHHEFVYRVRD